MKYPARTPLCAVIGDPVSHSLSPEIFAFIAAREKSALNYVRLRLTAAHFAGTASAVRATGLFVGWNVTIPHKERLIDVADTVSPEVRAIGAANVAHFSHGRITAHNTDAFGVEGTLREHRVPVHGRHCLILGAGGAARAAAFALGTLGAARVGVANRGPARARQLCADLTAVHPGTVFEVARLGGGGAGYSLVINSTPLGMKGYPARSLLPKGLAPGTWAFDLVYRPERTPFLVEARKRGLNTVGGLDMLVWQALASWRIWFGPLRQERALKRALMKHLRTLLEAR